MAQTTRHKWDTKTWKEKGYKTCLKCGTVCEKGYPVIYHRPYSPDMPYYKAGDCFNIEKLTYGFRGVIYGCKDEACNLKKHCSRYGKNPAKGFTHGEIEWSLKPAKPRHYCNYFIYKQNH